jgi:YHS domain-containing protein
MEELQQSQFKGWAVIEIMGHTRAAGFVTSDYFGNACLFRIDTPELPEREFVLKQPEYVSGKWIHAGATVKRPASEPRTKLIGPSSIFSLNPCTEELARAAIEEIYPRPLILLRLPDSKQIEAAQEHMVNDPVCGTQLKVVEGMPHYEYAGRTFLFCDGECRDQFVDDPENYLPEAVAE